MSETTPPEASYYAKNKEARKAYQKAYYEKNREILRRKKEIGKELDPEKAEEHRKYQRGYYYENRNELLKKRRDYRIRKLNGDD